MERVSPVQPTLATGQVVTTIAFERSDEVVGLFKQQFPDRAVSAMIDHTVTLLVYPPLNEQEQHQWRNALAAYYMR